MKTKICTDIKQSRELIKLGLDPKTADMHYWTAWAGSVSKEKRDTPIVGLPPKDAIETYWIPAWSLSALLDLLPESVSPDNDSYQIYYMQVYNHDSLHGVDYVGELEGDSLEGFCEDSFVDAAYKMIRWLIKHAYIETKVK